MIIDASSNDELIRYLSLVCHIIDRDTGEDLAKTHLFQWWDTRLKKGGYVLRDSEGSPVWYSDPKHPDGGYSETITARFRYRNIQTQFYIPKDMCRFYLEEIAERDIKGIELGNPNRDMEIIVQ